MELKVRMSKLMWLIPTFVLFTLGCRRRPPVSPEALHRAAEKGNVEWIQKLISTGSDVNARDQNKWTPLHWAILGDHRQAAELLITAGADVVSSRASACP